jgi:predicted DNA-binding transcriptional regulator YafY
VRRGELVMDILKHGEEVEVIEPDSLRQLLSKHLQQAILQYAK